MKDQLYQLERKGASCQRRAKEDMWVGCHVRSKWSVLFWSKVVMACVARLASYRQGPALDHARARMWLSMIRNHLPY